MLLLLLLLLPLLMLLLPHSPLSSKAALENLVSTYGEEVRNVSPIRTHIIDPGATRTTMRARAYPGEDPQRLKPPEDAAKLVVGALLT